MARNEFPIVCFYERRGPPSWAARGDYLFLGTFFWVYLGPCICGKVPSL